MIGLKQTRAIKNVTPMTAKEKKKSWVLQSTGKSSVSLSVFVLLHYGVQCRFEGMGKDQVDPE